MIISNVYRKHEKYRKVYKKENIHNSILGDAHLIHLDGFAAFSCICVIGDGL